MREHERNTLWWGFLLTMTCPRTVRLRTRRCSGGRCLPNRRGPRYRRQAV